MLLPFQKYWLDFTTNLKEDSYFHTHSFALESGEILPEVTIAYRTWGTINAKADNIIWVCHALTGSADISVWWADMLGKGRLFDTQEYFIICANMLGSCYGSTNALSLNPNTQQPYYHDFPLITNRDMVKAFDLLRQSLKIEKIKLLAGGSMGGQQALEWAISQPQRFENIFLAATNAKHSPWGIAFNEAQRMAIKADKTWEQKQAQAGLEGMRAARAMALISYRNYEAYAQKQYDETEEKIDDFKASSYQQYQGDKLAKRFNAFAYWTLSKAMDSHNVARGRGTLREALQKITANTLVIGIKTDGLFPVIEQQFIAENVQKGAYLEIDSPFGHDGFLIETEVITQHVRNFLQQNHHSNHFITQNHNIQTKNHEQSNS